MPLAAERSWRCRLGALVVLALAGRSEAQAEPAPAPRAIELTDERDGCLGQGALQARVSHYLSSSADYARARTRALRPSELVVRVQRSGATVEFAVVRAGESLARRRFSNLPKSCADRRDTLALAIALALEHAATLERSAR